VPGPVSRWLSFVSALAVARDFIFDLITSSQPPGSIAPCWRGNQQTAGFEGRAILITVVPPPFCRRSERPNPVDKNLLRGFSKSSMWLISDNPFLNLFD
jgi:hypothetical protein